MTVKTKILFYMNSKGWVSKADIESNSREWGALADNIDRRCRELVNEGKLEKQRDGKSIQYRVPRKEFDAEKFLETLRTKEQGVLPF